MQIKLHFNSYWLVSIKGTGKLFSCPIQQVNVTDPLGINVFENNLFQQKQPSRGFWRSPFVHDFKKCYFKLIDHTWNNNLNISIKTYKINKWSTNPTDWKHNSSLIKGEIGILNRIFSARNRFYYSRNTWDGDHARMADETEININRTLYFLEYSVGVGRMVVMSNRLLPNQYGL